MIIFSLADICDVQGEIFLKRGSHFLSVLHIGKGNDWDEKSALGYSADAINWVTDFRFSVTV